MLLARQVHACVFKEADCQANPSGLWGPDSASIVVDAKLKKQERASAVAAMDANYRALSAAVDFVSQVVDGNWGVHAVIRKSMFAARWDQN